MLEKKSCQNYMPISNYLSLKNTHLSPPFLSIVIPILNEAENLHTLINEIQTALEGQLNYEIIGIDDGSIDNSWLCLQQMTKQFDKFRIIRHRRSYGQSVAILTGVKVAQAEWIVTLDGDGQNDPADILRLLAILHQPDRPAQLQLITGYRRKRRDTWLKRWSSKMANYIRNRLLHDHTLDTGCGLKLFSRQAFLALPHFNHLHRFLPALILRGGGEILSVEVNHRPRQHGQSNYGFFNRLGVGIIDLLGVIWLQRRSTLAEIIEDNQENV